MVIKEIKQDEKKQHFDDIYIEPTPVPYKIRILDALEYISDNFNKEMFDAHILPWAEKQNKKLQFVELGACFGNTTMATIYGMSYDEIRENWKDETSCKTIQGNRRVSCEIIAADISGPAMAYGKQVGLYDLAITADLNARSTDAYKQVLNSMATADMILSTASLVYLDLESIEELISAFASSSSDKKKEGYILVNFLNPFGLEKADKTKQILLKHLDFVGSRATRHRRMSELEQSNYPGETWALLELWVLKRRG
jgi:hypothetical protein